MRHVHCTGMLNKETIIIQAYTFKSKSLNYFQRVNINFEKWNAIDQTCSNVMILDREYPKQIHYL